MAVDIVQDAQLGRTLGHYQMIQKIGEGGMGVVYRAHDQRLDRDVAVKILPEDSFSDDEARKRFHTEALILSKLSHPNIATVLDFGTEAYTDYLVEELVEGVSLDEMLATGPLNEKKIVQLGLQLCEGLAAAHEHRIIHRDIKPANLRVTSGERLKILDFGLAKTLHTPAATPSESLTTSEIASVVGTLPYISPEQLQGEKVDGGTDIWATGCVLYELATGRRPFLASGARLIDEILHLSPPPPSQLNHKLSSGLEAIIQKCLEKDRALRYGSALDIAVDLRRLQSGVLGAARTAGKFSTTRTVKALSAGIGVLIVALGILLAVDAGRVRERLARFFRVAPPIKSLAVLPVKNLSGGAGQEFFEDGMTDQLIASLAQIKSVKVVSRTSVMTYKSTNKTLPQIAKELGVDGVLEASVMRSGNRLRLTAQLIDGREDRHLWGNTYEPDLSEVLQMQSEIATSIAREIKAVLTPAEEARLKNVRTVDPETYEAYLKGQYYSAQYTVDSVPKAIAEFEVAIAKDPQYAPAYAGLANVYVWALGRQLPGLSDRVAFKLAENFARLAVQLDPELDQGHTTLGAVLSATLRPYSAEKEFRKALELNPNSAEAEMGYALTLLRLGRNDEAIAHAERAGELDPISPLMFYRRSAVHGWVGNKGRAEQLLQQRLDLDPNSPSACYLATLRNLNNGHHEKVDCDDRRIAAFGRNPERMAFLTFCYGKMGRQEDARQMFRQMEAHPDFPQMYPRMLAMAYEGIGDPAKAKVTLQRAWELRPPWYDEVLLGHGPKGPPDPRFEVIKREILASYAEDKQAAAASRP